MLNVLCYICGYGLFVLGWFIEQAVKFTTIIKDSTQRQITKITNL